MFSAIDFVSANEMFDITATTIPCSGNVIRYVVAADKPSWLPWPAIRVGRPARGSWSGMPAKTVAGLRARGQPLRRLEQLDGLGLQQRAAVDAHPEPFQVDGVDRNAAAPA